MFKRLLVVSLVALRGAIAYAQPAPEPEPEPKPQPPDRTDELARKIEQLEAEVRALRATPPPPPPVELPPPPPEPAPLAGYARKHVFLRDCDDLFVLLPKGRLNVDYYEFLRHPGTTALENSPQDPTQAIRDTLFIRRARLGLAGTIWHHIDFRIEGDFASVATTGQYGTMTDASIQLNWSRYAQVEVGQFLAPFTLENPTSENWTDFMERSAAVRFVAPLTREVGAMVLGDLPHDAGRYWIGLFDGDGQNFKNQDNLGAIIGRVHFTPFAAAGGREEWKQHLWIGGSFWAQNTDNLGGFVAPSTTAATQNDLSAVTTQGGVSLFNSSYGNAGGVRSHLAPDGWIVKHALELSVPLPRRFGFRSELVHQQISLREYNDANPGNGNLTRTRANAGLLDGWGGYAEVYAWLGGNADTDFPGVSRMPHWSGYQAPQPAAWSVMVAAKYEHVQFDVTGLAAGDPAVGQYALDVVEVGATLWLTRHARFMVNYVANYIGGNLANPASLETKNIFYHYSDHELLARFAVQL